MKITDKFLKGRPLSYSSLKQFAKTPEHYMEYLDGVFEPTAAMNRGSVMHCLLLEPEEFEKRYAVTPEGMDRRTTEGKAKYEKFMKSAEGKQVISNSDYLNAKGMSDAIKKNSAASKLMMQITTTEKRVEWTHKETKLPLCGYIDGLGDKIIVDVKSSKNADPEDFFRDAFRLGYHIQAALYVHGMMRKGKMLDYYFVVVEPAAPYGVAVFRADSKYLSFGIERLDYLCKAFRMWMDDDCPLASYEYHSPINGYHQLHIPSWATQS